MAMPAERSASGATCHLHAAVIGPGAVEVVVLPLETNSLARSIDVARPEQAGASTFDVPRWQHFRLSFSPVPQSLATWWHSNLTRTLASVSSGRLNERLRDIATVMQPARMNIAHPTHLADVTCRLAR